MLSQWEKLIKIVFMKLEITRGEGSYLIGTDGKKYLDLRSGLWNVSLGYNSELTTEF